MNPGGHPRGYPPPPYGYQPPRRRNIGLIVGVTIGIVVLITGGVLAVMLLLGDDADSSADARPTVDSYLHAVNERDAGVLVAVSCSLSESDGEYAISEFHGQDVTMRVLGEGSSDDRNARYWLEVTRGNPNETAGEAATEKASLLVTADGDGWCVSIGAGGMPT
ncbi:hypothetical protein EV191_1011306 [Tamaricihabitans halophyticus]|uniref:Uncharacterized protein n=1 Tax=Tamaricihabitans halophyticus TaxID=1262583 RepID=A0A4R2RC98_9PSEU|nr:hypothetical protein [Tamaricihabitans halophyticus]TCP57351.1 hypothetical protein EV191_1011306 [Tamaricihabitans halophyticus]